MIELNTDHPNFDMAMEVLCSLSPTPKSTAQLAKDLGVNGDGPLQGKQPSLQACIKRLRLRGYDITTERTEGGGGIVASIGGGWKNVQRDAEAYWNAVYERNPLELSKK